MKIKKTSLLIPLERESTSTSTFTAKFPKLGKGQQVQVQGVSAMNDTSAGTRVSVGVCRGGTNYYVETLVLTTAGYYYTTTHGFMYEKDDRVIVKFEGHSSGDGFNCLLCGYIEEEMKE